MSRPAANFMAGVLALGVHGVFLLLLVFGVSWQTQHPAPVMVDLWETLPAEPASAKRPPPIKKIEPAKRDPAPSRPPVVKEPPTPKTPDIALEKKKADAKRMAEEKSLAEVARMEAEAVRKVHEKQLADQKKRELLRQMEAEELRQRMTEESAANEARQAKQAEAQAAAGRRQTELTRTVGQYRDKISATVRGNTRLPDNLQGNPEVRCLVRLLPTGEVLGVRVTQGSGNAAYDAAVVRAIELSSPLPLPADRDARAEFVPELLFVHRPK